jgi:hypothetical protein
MIYKPRGMSKNVNFLHYVTATTRGGLRYSRFATGLECVRQTALATVLAVFVERHLRSQSISVESATSK